MVSRRTLWFRRTLALAWIGVVIIWPAVGLSIFGVWCVYIVLAACYYQAYLARSLERGLGFRHGKQYLPSGRLHECAVALKWVAKDGVFAQAGFREGDVLPDVGSNELFRKLHRHRGQMAELEVADGGAGPSFRERARRPLRFAVPPVGEYPPTRQDALVAFSIVWPFLFGAIGGIVGYVFCQRLDFANSSFLPILTLLGSACLGMLLGFGFTELSLRGDDHDLVTRPIRPSEAPGCGAI